MFIMQQDKNTVNQHAVDEIILQEKEQLSVKDETHENINDELYEYDLYELDQMSLDEK